MKQSVSLAHGKSLLSCSLTINEMTLEESMRPVQILEADIGAPVFIFQLESVFNWFGSKFKYNT